MYLDKNLQTKNKREIEIENFKRDTTHQEKGRDRERAEGDCWNEKRSPRGAKGLVGLVKLFTENPE